MSGPTPNPLFLERQSYRRRRIIDAARLLPVLGVTLLAIPLLWPSPAGDAVQTGWEPVKMSSAIFYIFGVWIVLILLTFLFGTAMRDWSPGDNETPAERD